MSSIDLSSRAMLVSLKVSQWTARKFDKKATREFNATHNAEADAGRYNKVLVARDRIASVNKAGRALRDKHNDLTLPWKHDGQRILPAASFASYSEEIRKLRLTFESAVAEFVRDYPVLVEDAKIRLNGLFNAEDYPDPAHIACRFGVETRIEPVPTENDFRVSLSDELAATVKSQIAKDNAAVLDVALDSLWDRLHGAVYRMANDLAIHGKTLPGRKAPYGFRTKAVTDVRDIVKLGPSLNLTDDPELADILLECSKKLCVRSADALRTNAVARSEQLVHARELSARLGARFRDAEPEPEAEASKPSVADAMDRMSAFMGA